MTDKTYDIYSLYLNTIYRDAGTISSPQFTINPSFNDIQAYKVKQFVCPLSVPVVDSRNNKIYFAESSGTLKTASLGELQDPSPTVFASTIQTALNSIGNSAYAVSYNTSSNKLVIANSTGTFRFSTNGSLNDTPHVFYEAGLMNSLNTSLTTSYTSENIDISGIKQINIFSNNLSNINIVGRNRNLLTSIITEESNLSVSQFQDDSADFIKTNNNNLSNIQLELRDERFRSITLDKDFTLQLLLKS